MKTIKHLFAFCLALAMLFAMVVASGVFTVSAMNGAGLQQTTFRSYGADISFWNVSVSSGNDYSRVDFAKMKASGCEYVILRIGYEASATRQNVIDSAFIEYYKRGRAAGMPMGVYFYQLGDTYEKAVEDAQWVINIIEENDMYFEYPIYYDVEDLKNGDKPVNLQGQAMENLCLGWCETLEKAGYFPGIYGGGWSVIDKLSDDFRSKYDTWYAAYPNAQNPHLTRDYSDYCGMWQYAASGYNYDGVPAGASLDVNVCYKDYPAIMKQYGYNNCVDDGSITYKKSYTSTGIYEENGVQLYPDTNGTELTDGKSPASNGEFDDPAFVGFNSNSPEYAKNGYASVTVDLGKNYKIDSFNAKVATKFHADAGILAPKEVSFYVSYDNTNWYKAGSATISDSETNSVTDAKFTAAENTYARYIQYRFVGDSSWVMVSEVEAFGKEATTVPQYPVPNPGDAETPADPPVQDENYDTTGNVALGKTYDTKGYSCGGEWPANYTASLTDGKAYPIVEFSDKWFGFCTSEGNDGINAPDGVGKVTIDLGDVYDINSIKAFAVLGENVLDSGVYGPKKVSAYVSEQADGQFTYAGDLKANVTEGGAWMTLDTDVKGRYVKIEVTLNGTFAFMNEIAVYGTEAADTPVDPDPKPPVDEPVDPKPPVDEPIDPKPPVDEPKFMKGDINENGEIDSMDYVYLRRAYFGTYMLEDINVGDIDEDGEIGSMDYVYLRRAYFGTYKI